MFGKKILLCAVLLLLLPTTAWAHTGLKKASPNKEEVMNQEVNSIILEFNGAIEPLSTLKLVNQQGEEIKVGPIEVNDNNLQGSINPALPDGEYTVQWKIIGEDGHPIKGTYSFTVELPVQKPTSSPIAENEKDKSTENLEQTETKALSTKEGLVSAEASSASVSNQRLVFWLTVIILGLLLAGIVFISRRKRRDR
jgi:methionine-rich copper-binding protein CopC